MTRPKRTCAICGKGYRRSVSRSHSMQGTLRRLKPNLQWLQLSSDKRIKACTKCIKSIAKGKIKTPHAVQKA